MDITDDNAFDVLQEVLAGRRRVPLDDATSNVLRTLLTLDPDWLITQPKFEVWLGPHRPSPLLYQRRLGPTAISGLLSIANATSVESGVLIHLPPGQVKKVRRFVPWSYEAKLIWLLPGRDEVLIRVRMGDPSLETAFVEPCAVGSPKVPLPLPQWKPAEKTWRTFNPPLTCPKCGVSSKTYRDGDTFLVCQACGCSFDLHTGDG